MSPASPVSAPGSQHAGQPPAPPSAPSGSVAPPGATRPTPPTSPTRKTRRRKYLGYEVGSAYLRRRLGALIIDNLVCLPLMIPCAALMGGMSPGAWTLYITAYTLYFFLLEVHTGQTLGKRAAGLRVVRVDGRPVDAMGIGARNALRLLDGIPGPPLLGALSMTLTGPRRRRIGDLAGRTIVVEASEHVFVRGPWSPLIVVYPVLWVGLALGVGLVAGTGQAPYLAKVDSICQARLEAEGSARSFEQAVALSHHEVRLIEALPYPSDLTSTREEILALKRSILALYDETVRDMRASSDPQRTFEAARPRAQAMTDQYEARLVAMGLNYCGR